MNKVPMSRTGRSWSLAWTFCLGATLLLASPLVSLATMVVVVVTVVAPPSCEINGARPIEVNFHEMVTTHVDGNNYKKDIVYDIKCTGTPNDMSIHILGTDAGFGSHVLATTKANLGIALLNNGQPLPFNTKIKFAYPSLPKLQAVPVKYPGSTLKGGVFSTGTSMVVEYQ